MTLVSVLHETTYRYSQPVVVNPHRLMVHPRQSPTLRLHSLSLHVEPDASVTWSADAFDNVIATATFQGPQNELCFRCQSQVEILAPEWPVFDIAASAIQFPFEYGSDERDDLGSLVRSDQSDPLAIWARSFVASYPTDTLSLLKDINNFVFATFRYEQREQEGTQAPADTLALRSGSCRDFAELFTQAVRTLGFGARAVSGYLWEGGLLEGIARGGASTHAWSEVYIPGPGWIPFDPTNGTVGAAYLIPVAVGSQMHRLTPVEGSYAGPSDAFTGMTVSVQIGS
ncbi:MAG: transglutaminase N-terminal domain-containing protein [Lautropia sp.]